MGMYSPLKGRKNMPKRYRLTYSSKFQKINNFISLLFSTSLLDCGVAAVIDIVLLFPIMYITGNAYLKIMKTEEVPKHYFLYCFLFLACVEFVIILIVEIKRRFIYCEFREKGIYVYNNNGVKFGYGNIFKKNAIIPYDEINACYISTGEFVTKSYSALSYFKRFKNRLLHESKYDYIPAIAYGDFENDCIILELENKKGVVLPIENCEQFIAEYESITKQSDK